MITSRVFRPAVVGIEAYVTAHNWARLIDARATGTDIVAIDSGVLLFFQIKTPASQPHLRAGAKAGVIPK